MSTVTPRQSVVVLHVGDYLDRIEHLRHRAVAAAKAEEDGRPRRVGEVGEADRLAKAYAALVAEADAAAVKVRVQALGRREWRALVAKHPPRVGNKEDEAVGLNEDTFPDDLVAASVVAAGPVDVVGEPAFSSRAAFDEWVDSLSSVDFERVYLAAFALNRVVGADPKPLPSSVQIPGPVKTSS